MLHFQSLGDIARQNEECIMKRIAAAVLPLLVLVAGCSDVRCAEEPKETIYYSYFDTVSYIYSYAGDSEAAFAENAAIASGVLEEYHRLLDIYHEYAGMNNLCTVNRLAGGEPVTVDRKLIDFLCYAVELYEITDGEMNVMMGAVLRPWHDCYTQAVENPSAAAIPEMQTLENAARYTDIALLEIDIENCTVRIASPFASIDVGALGKGYATEKAAQALISAEAEGYVLNIGGNIRIIGNKRDGSEWLTGVRDPADPDGAYARYLRLSDISCVTSGNYERFFTADGVRYHHIIDRDTKMPASYFASVTVLTADSGLADALSTALFCMSYEDGLALLKQFGDVEVLWIRQDGQQLCTDGVKALTEEQ